MSRDPEDDWQEKAKCLDLDTEQADRWFFPATPNGFHAAQRFCNGKQYATDTPCPVRAECLTAALDYEAPDPRRHGVWGGKTPLERHAIARKTA